MWDLAIEFDIEKQEWLNGPFLKISYTITEKKIENYMKTTTKLIKQFTELEEDCKIILLNILIYN